MITVIQDELKAFLKQEERLIPRILAKMEKSTNIDREHIVYTAASIFSIYLIFGQRAELLCHTVGVLYPVYATLKIIPNGNPDHHMQWMSYWSVFGLLCLMDAVIDDWPMYWLIKCMLLLILYLPIFRGAELIYVNIMAPLFNLLYPYIEKSYSQNQTQTKVDNKKQQEKILCFTPPQTPIMNEQ